MTYIQVRGLDKLIFIYFPFLVLRAEFAFDCASSCSLLFYYFCMGYQINTRELVNDEVSLQFLNVSFTLSAYQELKQVTIAL